MLFFDGVLVSCPARGSWILPAATVRCVGDIINFDITSFENLSFFAHKIYYNKLLRNKKMVRITTVTAFIWALIPAVNAFCPAHLPVTRVSHSEKVQKH